LALADRRDKVAGLRPWRGITAAPSQGRHMPATVLVCDNEDVLRTLVRAALGDRGYRIAEARDGEESLEVARETKPDLIILDMLMPGRSGLEVLTELRQDPAFASTPVIVLTARAQASDREAALRAHADRFLAKPFSPRELAAMVDELLDESRSGERNNGRKAEQQAPAPERGRERHMSLVRARVARAEAQASEQEYRALTEAIPQHLWAAASDARVTFANERARSYLGLSDEDELRAWEDFIHPDDLPSYVEQWSRAVETGAPLELEARLRRADGEYRWHLITASPAAEEQGQVLRWVGTNTDVDERKRWTRRLSCESAVARVLAESSTVSEAASRLLHALCEHLGWEAGALWVADPGANALACIGLWRSPVVDLAEFETSTLELRVRRDAGLVGKVWASGEPLWVRDIEEVAFVSGSVREEKALGAGLRSAFVFPVSSADGDVRGVIELHSRRMRDADESILEIASGVGSEVGEFIERKEAEEALGETRARQRAEQRELKRTLGELASEKERLQAFYGFGEQLLASEAEDFDRTLVDRFCEFAEADVGFLYKREEGGREQDPPTLVLAGTRGIERGRIAERIHVGEGAAGRALALRLCLPVSYPDDPLPLGTHLVRHTLHVPLHHHDRELGVLTLGRSHDRAFVDAEVSGIEELSRLAGAAFSNALALEGARRLSNLGRAVLDATDEAIRVVDTRGNEIVANAAMERLVRELHFPFGEGLYAREREFADRTVDPAGYRVELQTLLDDPELVARHEVELAEPGRIFQRYTAPVRDSLGAVIGRIFVLRDVTGERVAERAREDLIATVSHELRTPLTGISGFAEILLDHDLDADARRRHLETIHGEVKRLTSLIDMLLDLERLKDRRVPLSPEPFRLDELLKESVQLFSGESSEHTISLELPRSPLDVVADRDRITQVVSNLLSNAIKYSPGGGTIRVWAEHTERGVKVVVGDPGIGIPVDQQERVFSRFFRAQSAGTRGIQGLGLGLALSREIIAAHDGEMGFESAEGDGSTFWFELPAGES
jgi:PAS domain S-box-containing protein